MPRKQVTPSYRLHETSGQARVTIGGRDHYLGTYGSAESREKYGRLIAEWCSRGNALPPRPADAAMTVAELCVRYLAHADTYYRRADGSPTNEPYSIRQAMRPLNRLYSRLPAADFSPMKLVAVRGEMVRMQWARTNINRQVARIKQLFRWGVEQEIVPGAVHQSLAPTKGIAKGRDKAVVESEPVRPVDDAKVRAVIAVLSPSLAALISATDAPATPALTTEALTSLAAKAADESPVACMIFIQLKTGMRPGELCGLTAADVQEVYRPAQHKNAHRGQDRTIHFGPKARRALAPFLARNPTGPLFSPAEAEDRRNAQRRANRQTPMTPSHARRRRRRRKIGPAYTVSTYRRAIARACDAAFPLPSELAAAWKEVRTWADKWTYAHDYNAPRLSDYPRDLREKRDAVEAFKAAQRWHPHQLRHNFGTAIRKAYGAEKSQMALGHKTMAATQIYAEADQEAVARILEEIG